MKFPRVEKRVKTVLRRYKGLASMQEEVDAAVLPQRLRERLDLDSYLQWMSVNTYLKNGDYIDEVFFYAVYERGEWYWRIHGWDQDDLFGDCPDSGDYAYEDPDELLYCSEARLDKSIYDTPALCADFVSALDLLIEKDLPSAVIANQLDTVRDELFQLLSDKEDCAAMTEVGETTCDALRASIQISMAEFLEDLRVKLGDDTDEGAARKRSGAPRSAEVRAGV